jgi:hypothetical protein
MRPKTLRGIVLFGIAAIIIVSTSNCSLMGLGVGAVVDHHKPDSLSTPGWKVDNLKPGKKIAVVFRDGTQLSGRYRGIGRFPQNGYAQRYNFFREKSLPDVVLPPLGDTIVIILKSGVSMDGEFLGFDYQYQPTEIWRTEESYAFNPVLVSIKAKGNAATQSIPSSKFTRFADSEGNGLARDVLERLANEGKIPFLSAISLEISDSLMLIPRENVFQIERKNNKNAKWVGLGIGAAIDVVAMISFAVILSSVDLLGDGDW